MHAATKPASVSLHTGETTLLFDSRIVIRDATLADADALDTALMVMGTEKALSLPTSTI